MSNIEDVLIGKRVMIVKTRQVGIIRRIIEGTVEISIHGEIIKFAFPDAFSNILELEELGLQSSIQESADEASFENFKTIYKAAIGSEMGYLKANGGKKYRIIDGEKISYSNAEYLYSFDTDSDLHFPEGTEIKMYFPDNIIIAHVVSCEDFSILLRTEENLGEKIESIEISAEQWFLLEALIERIDELSVIHDKLAYRIACCGKNSVLNYGGLRCGQDAAFIKSTTEDITFIWGPPGTGKTDTLAKITLEHIEKGRRVLMLSVTIQHP